MDDVPQPGSLEAEAGVFCSTFDLTGTRLITGGADKTIKVCPCAFVVRRLLTDLYRCMRNKRSRVRSEETRLSWCRDTFQN